MKNRRQEHMLNPHGTATRTEIATILTRFDKMFGTE